MDANPPPTHNTEPYMEAAYGAPTGPADPDSDISDIEAEDYCDFSREDNTVLNLRLRKVKQTRIKQLYRNPEQVYQMSDPIRGRALIININKFKYEKERKGSEIDYNNMEILLKHLKFDVAKTQEKLTDLTAERIYGEIEEETQRPEHKAYGMFVLVIMSHGGTGDVIFDTNSVPVPLVKIQDLLSPLNFPAMKNKPKLMIVQADSGNRVDYGDSKASSVFLEPSPRAKVEPATFPTEDPPHGAPSNDSPSASPVLPEPAGVVGCPPSLPTPPLQPTVFNADDFLIMKASSESYLATRSSAHGSVFIRTLVATFYKHSNHRDVEALFKIVQKRTRDVSIQDESSGTREYLGGNVPTCKCTFTNYRKLYLFPKYPESER